MRITQLLVPVLLLSTAVPQSQQGASLGDIARRIRAEKNKAAHPDAKQQAPSAAQQSVPLPQPAATPSQSAQTAQPAQPTQPAQSTTSSQAAQSTAQDRSAATPVQAATHAPQPAGKAVQPPSSSAQPVSASAATQPAGKPDAPKETEAQAMVRHLAEQKAQADQINLHETGNYEEAIRTFFGTESFQRIDQIADTERSTKRRLPGGFWAIHLLYFPLSAPLHGSDSTESEWHLHLAELQKWIDQRPQSITARVALAMSYVNYGWKARGGGTADEVTEEGWQLLAERSDKAGKILVDAFNLPAKDPEWYLTMQGVLEAQGASKAMQTAMFEKAIAFEPDYQYYYRQQANMLLPKWEGEEGEAAMFAEQQADRIGGKKGDMMYYMISTVLNCGCDSENQPNGMSWQRIKRGYAAVEEQYGASLENMNQMARFAGAAGDPAFAHDLFKRIGENWDPKAWKTRKYFETVRDWAGFSDIEQTAEQGLKQAEANVKTPQGRQFDAEIGKTFAANYNDILAACVKLAGEPKQTPFDLLLQIGSTGTVNNLFFSVPTRVSMCLASKVQSGKFPAPPQPDYWVKININFQH